jgi:hypothetical protein
MDKENEIEGLTMLVIPAIVIVVMIIFYIIDFII